MGIKPDRLKYIDNLRLLMIVFVVIQHLAVTYSGFGSWYYKEGVPLDFVQTAVFGFYQSFTQGYFMGFLFLLAGYFVPGAYDRKGLGRFAWDRFVRLMIPTLIYMLIIHPFILYVQLGVYWIVPKPGFPAFYGGYIASFDFLSGSGPLWFAFALFIFSVIYGLVRRVFRHVPAVPRHRAAFNAGSAAGLILVIAALAFLIRLVQPIGTSVMNMQICYFAQYMVLFVVGTVAYRYDLFSQINFRKARGWLWTAIVGGYAVWSAIMLLGGALEGNQSFNGGLTWQAAAYALWESFTAVAVSVGLIGIFKEKYNSQGRLLKILSANAFAVYVFHTPIVIAAAQWFSPVSLLPIVKFMILTAVCLPLCFAFTHFVIRRVPLLKRVM